MKSVGQIFIFCILKSITAIVLVMLAAFQPPLLAQLHDDFSDGDFTTNPAWAGTTSDFVVLNEELRLNASSGKSSAYLSTSSTGNYGSWELRLGFLFNPSNSNYARFYVMSNSSELEGPLDGYYVQAGGTDDDVSLYRQSGTVSSKIIDGTNGRLNLAKVSLMIKVLRSPSGEWRLLSKIDTEDNFYEEGMTPDDEMVASQYAGILCKFTSTRSDKFIFDDVTIESGRFDDTIPPAITGLEPIDNRGIEISFNEALDSGTVQTISNYEVYPSIGNPVAATLLPDQSTIRLEFADEFASGLNYIIALKGIRDLAGNAIEEIEMSFAYGLPTPASFKDVIISELFPDPSPAIGLPEAEFLELYNRSGKVLNLENWTITDGTSKARLNTFHFKPGSYLILCPASATGFEPFGDVMKLSSFPSLNNSGDALVLRNPDDTKIDSVAYTDAWFRSSEKKSGGWTLELIDPENTCAEDENWTASEAEAGGTPGQRNSVFAEKPDLTGPRLLRAIPLAKDTLSVVFDEKLEDRVPGTSSFSFHGTTMAQAIQLQPDLKSIVLVVSPPFESGKLYAVTVTEVFDCAGNVIRRDNNQKSFALPEKADSLDVVVNELLFNPRPGGVDFLEILNRSDKFLDLRDWKTANLEGGEIKNARPVTTEHILLYPGQIIAFSQDIERTRNDYPSSIQGNLSYATLPPFNDDYGSVALVSPDGRIIDSFSYDESMHSKFVRDPEGVSLERIFPDRSSGDPDNWKSGGSVAGFATPGLRNSSTPDANIEEDRFMITPEVFQPATGQPDFTAITFNLQRNVVANVRIYDARGRLIRILAEGETLGAKGFLRWDGDQEDGSKARIGSYMIRIELFDETGEIDVIMKRVVIAGRF